MGIEKLKIGDYLYQFSSSLFHKNCPWNDYSFSEIIGETPKYWKLNGSDMVRKSDLKVKGGYHNFSCYHVMDKKSIEAKARQSTNYEKDGEK